MKYNLNNLEYEASYTTCLEIKPLEDFYYEMHLRLSNGKGITIFFCEPDMNKMEIQSKLLSALNTSFEKLKPQAGYYDIPEVRDFVADYLKVPEAAFDEGINILLSQNPAPITVGLQYEKISGKRKPLLRNEQLYNLIRRN